MIGQALIEAFLSFTDWALGLGGSSLNFVTRTPAAGTYESPTVRSLWDFSRALVNVALAAIVMSGDFNIMVKEHTRSPYHEVMELLPRVILAVLAANLTLECGRFLIDMNNALAASVGDVGLPGYYQATPSQEGIVRRRRAGSAGGPTSSRSRCSNNRVHPGKTDRSRPCRQPRPVERYGHRPLLGLRPPSCRRASSNFVRRMA